MKKTITIEVTGDTESDINLALEQAIEAIAGGAHSGGDSNDTGGYHFSTRED